MTFELSIFCRYESCNFINSGCTKLAISIFNILPSPRFETILYFKCCEYPSSLFLFFIDILEKLIPESPIAQKVLDFRELSKLKSTYLDALVKYYDAQLVS